MIITAREILLSVTSTLRFVSSICLQLVICDLVQKQACSHLFRARWNSAFIIFTHCYTLTPLHAPSISLSSNFSIVAPDCRTKIFVGEYCVPVSHRSRAPNSSRQSPINFRKSRSKNRFVSFRWLRKSLWHYLLQVWGPICGDPLQSRIIWALTSL